MRIQRHWPKLLCPYLVYGWLVFTLIPCASAAAGVFFTNLVSFAGTNGATPHGALLEASDGYIYGTTQGGGDYGAGTVFKLSLDGALITVASFDSTNGAAPNAGLAEGPDGCFYGTTGNGGSYNKGTVFKVCPGGVLTAIFSFDGTNGVNPSSQLVVGGDGNLYGTALSGGTLSDPWYEHGLIFRVGMDGLFSPFALLSSAEGSYPFAGLLRASDGCLYGTTMGTWTPAEGQIYPRLFRVTLDGELTVLGRFYVTNGAGSHFPLVQARDGTLYGAGAGGENLDRNGNAILGVVYRGTTNGELSSLFSFNGTNGSMPRGLLVARDGNLYGITAFGGTRYGGTWNSGDGTIFRLTPAGSLTTLVTFTNNEAAFSGLLEARDGNLYGTTGGGGIYNGGAIFRLTIPMSPVFQEASRFGNQITFSWSAVAGLKYQLESSSDLVHWEDVGPLITATNGLAISADVVGTASHRLYRVSLRP